MKLAFVFFAMAMLAGCDDNHSTVDLSRIATPANGYCNPNMVSCGYEQPRCMSIAPSQRAAAGCYKEGSQ